MVIVPVIFACVVLFTNCLCSNGTYEDLFPFREQFHELSEQRSDSVEPPLLIGSFNIQTLSEKKFKKSHVMTIVEKVILRYDLIYIMEILTTDPIHMKKLLTVINNLTPGGVRYNLTLSSYHPQNSERSAFLYRTDKLRVVQTEAYTDNENRLYRKPYVVHFNALTLRDMDEFVAVGLHVKPSQAVQEINALANVYDYISNTYNIKDVLLMGDFNADCDYVKEGDWNSISLWTRFEFRWAINNHHDTTTNYKSCALDRFVYAGENMFKGIIVPSAGVFNFQKAFGLTREETKEVSDHWPIEIQIRGKMSKETEANLHSLVCVTLTDSRITKMPNVQTVLRQAKSVGFSRKTNNLNSTTVDLINESNSEDQVFSSLQKLRTLVPELVSIDQLHGVMYKVRYGSLKDSSSFADLSLPVFYTKVIHLNQRSTITVCRKTTVN